MIEMRQDMSGEQVCFCGVWIARQDEGFDALCLIGVEFRQNLIGIADNGGTAARTRAANAGPQIVLDKAFIPRLGAQFGLALDAVAGGIERFGADRVAGVGIEF